MRPRATLALALAVAGCARAGGPAVPEPPGAEETPERPEAVGPLPAVEAPPDVDFSVPLRFAEVRGLWVVRTTLKTPELVRAMVAEAEAGGFNTLLVQVRGRGDAFYASRWEPRGEQLLDVTEAFDPLALVIEEAHARGMAVHAWVNTNLVWSGETLPRSPNHLVNANPEWLAVPRGLAAELFDVHPRDPAYVAALRRYATDNTDSVEGVFASPAHPAVRARVMDVWVDLVERYDLDGLHFDYVRYPTLAFDYARGALDRFRDWVAPRLDSARLASLDARYRSDPFAFTDSLRPAFDEFRRAQITATVEATYYAVKARRPDLVVSAAVFPEIRDARTNRFQDWPRWLDEGIVDVVVPMAYTPDDETFRRHVAAAVREAGARERIWAGVGIFVNDLEGDVSQIETARALGTGGVVLFSYDWARDNGGRVGGVPFLQALGRRAFGR